MKADAGLKNDVEAELSSHTVARSPIAGVVRSVPGVAELADQAVVSD